jgi:hypothetical protein
MTLLMSYQTALMLYQICRKQCHSIQIYQGFNGVSDGTDDKSVVSETRKSNKKYNLT